MLAGSINGIVFSDLNQDGVFQPAAGELPIADRTVFVDLNRNGKLDSPTEPAAATGDDGKYLFDGLAAGSYSIAEAPAADYVQSFPLNAPTPMRRVNVSANDLGYDAVNGKLYASVGSNGGALANSIVAIDPATGSVVGSVAVGSEPGKLAISDNGQYLYVVLTGSKAIRRVDLPTLTAGLQFSLGDLLVDDLDVMPGHAGSLAVSRYTPGLSPRGAGVVIYDDGVPRPAAGSGTVIDFSSTGSELYSYNNEISSFEFKRMTVSASGLTTTNDVWSLFGGPGTDIEFDGGRIYATNGTVVDPETQTILGTFAGGGSVEPDSARGITFFLAGNQLKAFDQQTFLPISSFTVPGVTDSFYGLVRFGASGLAFRTTTGQVAMVDWNPLRAANQATVVDNQQIQGLNFGNVLTTVPGSISGNLFHDANGGGIRGPGEPGLAGWTVYLDQNGNGQLDSGERTQTTDAFGNYTFAGVAPGDYVVNKIMKPGWQQTAPVPQEGRVRQLNIPANDIAYDPVGGKIYASVGSGGGTLGNSIVAIDPVSGAMVSSVFVGSEPGKLAVSDDGQFLYVVLTGARAIRRVDLQTFTASLQFSLGDKQVDVLDVLPGNAHALAVSRYTPGVSPRGAGVVLYDDGVPRPAMGGGTVIDFSSTGKELYSYNNELSTFEFNRMTVSASGLNTTNSVSQLFGGAGTDIEFDGGRIYATNGAVVDPEARKVLGSFSGGGSVEPDSSHGLTYFLAGNQLKAFDQQTFQLVRSFNVPNVVDSSYGLIHWGANGLVFRSSTGQVVLVEWNPRNPLGNRVQAAHVGSGQSVTGKDFGNLNPAPTNPPIGNYDSFSTLEDTALTIGAGGVLANDTDVDNPVLTAVLVAGPANGTAALNLDGSFVYSLKPNFAGTDSFTYKANDGQGLSAETTVTLTVTAINDAPTAVNNSYSTPEDTARTVNVASGVLANDTDADANAFTAILETGPAHGKLSFAANGSFTYTPNSNFSGTDKFTYRAFDGQLLSNIATVTLSVTATNDAPVAAADSFNLTQDATLTAAAPGLLANDADVENSTLTATLGGGPSTGTLTLNTNGGFTYTPAAGFFGIDSFTYRASDGQLSSPLTTVILNVAPANPASISGRLFNDLNQNGIYEPATGETPLAGRTVYVDSNNNGVFDPGVEQQQVTGSDGSYSFIGLAPGKARISQIAPIGWRATAPLSSPNVLATGDGNLYEYTRNGDLVSKVSVPVPNSGGSFWDDTDVAVDQSGRIHVLQGNYTQAYISTYTPWSKTWEYHLVPGMSVPPSMGNNEISILNNYLYYGRVRINLTDWSSITYTIPPGTIGLANLQVGANGMLYGTDAASPNHGLYEFDPETFALLRTITLLDENGAALSNAGAAVSSQGDIFVAANRIYHFSPSGVLLNSAKIDSNNWAPTDINLAADGYLVVGDDNGHIGLIKTDLTGAKTITTAPGSISPPSLYTSFATYQGTGQSPVSYFLDLKSSDNRTNLDFGSVFVGVNSAIAVQDDSYSTPEGIKLILPAPGVLANDGVPGNSSPAVTGLKEASHDTLFVLAPVNADGSVTYTPAKGYRGYDSFTYRVRNGAIDSGEATVTITVTPPLDPPVATADSYTTGEDAPLTISATGVLANDTDPRGSSLTAALVTLPIHGQVLLKPDGGFVYVPNADYSGVDSFTYQASDGLSISAEATVTLTITPANDAPLVQDESFLLVQGVAMTLAARGVLANDTDLDGDVLVAVAETLPAHGVLVLNSGGGFVYTPAAGFSGKDSFTYRPNDGQVSSGSAATVTIVVAPALGFPLANGDSYTTSEDTALSLTAPGVLANDSDPDGQTLSAVLGSGPAHGTLTLAPAGNLTYQPAGNYFGVDSFTYRATDGVLFSNLTTVSLTVTSVNDPPVAAVDSYSTSQEVLLTISAPGLMANDTDADGDALTASLVDGPAHGAVVVNPNGSFSYQPASGYFGPDSFTYRASDGAISTAPVKVALNVVSAAFAPKATDDSFTMGEDITPFNF